MKSQTMGLAKFVLEHSLQKSELSPLMDSTHGRAGASIPHIEPHKTATLFQISVGLSEL